MVKTFNSQYLHMCPDSGGWDFWYSDMRSVSVIRGTEIHIDTVKPVSANYHHQ